MSRESVWDPATYSRYADHRSRPFYELVGRIGATSPRRVVDLGCGSGELTATLAQRWPDAHVVGMDSSAEMLAAAEALTAAEAGRTAAPAGRVEFRQADITSWRAAEPVDVLVSNAAFQWVPGHLALLPSLVSSVVPGGWFAFQVPGNFDAPSHALLAQLRQSDRWRGLVGADAQRAGSHEPADYLAALMALGCSVDAWETTYLQVLSGADPVLEWTKGTALRPVVSALSEEDAAEFLAEYGELLRAAYPPSALGPVSNDSAPSSLRTASNDSAPSSLRTVFPFRRIFVVAHLAP